MDMRLHVIIHGECVCVHSLNGPKISCAFPSWPLSHDVVLEFKRRRWYVVDKSSALGVYVNGYKFIPKGPVALTNATSISVGPPDEAILKYECFFPSECKGYVPDQKNKRLRTDSNDLLCSGNNCCEGNPAKQFMTQLLVSNKSSPNGDNCPYLTRSRSGAAAKALEAKGKSQKNGNKDVKEDTVVKKFQQRRKRKSSEVDGEDAIESFIAFQKESIERARALELKNLQTRCSELETTIAQQKVKFSQEIKEVLEKSFTCAICLELYIKAVSLNCAHTFCSKCLDVCKKDRRTCPVCRARITEEYKSVAIDNFIDAMVDKMGTGYKERRKKIVAERRVEESRSQGNQPPSTSRGDGDDEVDERHIHSAVVMLGLVSRLISATAYDSD